MLHHPDAKTATPEQIHQWHLTAGYAGFGYNEYIRKDGTVYIGRGDNIGAQCKDNNSKSYGICCEGDYDVEKDMPKPQFDALIERLKYHKARLKNLVDIKPHSYFNPTSCPGKYFPLQKIYNALQAPATPTISFKGKLLVCEVRIDSGMSYAPIRSLCEQMGYTVGWDESKKRVIIE